MPDGTYLAVSWWVPTARADVETETSAPLKAWSLPIWVEPSKNCTVPLDGADGEAVTLQAWLYRHLSAGDEPQDSADS